MQAATPWEQPSTNLQTLLSAQVFAEYGSSVVMRRFGTSSLGQQYCIFARKRLLGGYQTHMVTENQRNRPFISAPFKVSHYQVLEEARAFIDRLMAYLSSARLFPLGHQPDKVFVPVGKSMLQLDPVADGVHDCPEKHLQIGDEVYVECILSGITFFHSGIYAGDGMVYHFMSNSQDVDSSLVSALSTFAPTPAAVLLEPWSEFVYALMERGESPPQVYRVTHPLLCRTPDQILGQCELLRKEWDYYDIRNRNCQHFSSLCSTGAAVSYDMGSHLKFIACTIMRPSGMLAAQRINSL